VDHEYDGPRDGKTELPSEITLLTSTCAKN